MNKNRLLYYLTCVSFKNNILLPIGFDFDYWEETVDSFYIVSNGWISFDSDADEDYAIGLPVHDEDYDNSIFMIDVDLDPEEGGEISYATIGAAPNRILVIDFDSVAYYEDNDVRFSAQLHLHEGTNIIEMHTESADNYLNDEPASQGIQSPDEDVAIVVPGRDETYYSVFNDYMAFVPVNTLAASTSFVVEVLGTSSSTDSITVCDSYTWYGNTYSVSGLYDTTFVGANSVGCDSTAFLHLTILNSTSSYTSIANYDNYLWNGDLYDSTGIYTYITTNAVGCDSTATLDLLILDNPFANVPAVICENDSSFSLTVADTNETITGIGLDSTLTFDPLTNGVGTYTLIADYNVAPEGYLVSQSGSFNYINIDAVADTFDANLHVNSNYDAGMAPIGFLFEAEGVACDSMLFIDGLMAPIGNGNIPIIVLSASAGFGPNGSFDLLSEIGVLRWATVGSAPNRVFVLEAIDLPYINDSTLTYSAQAHFFEGSNHIEIHTKDLDGIGMNELFVQALMDYQSGGSVFAPGRDGSQAWSVTNDFVSFTPNPGLSATVSHTIEVAPTYNETATINACDSYTWGNGQVFTSDTVTTYTYQSINGCDSIVTLNLTINYSNSGSTTITSCDEYFWDGVTYTATGVYTNTYTNANGCDSIHTLDLTINYSSTHTQSFAFSNGGSVTVGTSTYTTPGTYTDVLTNAVGCDSTITTTVVVYYYNNYTQAITICDGESVSVNGNTYTTNGVYVDTILVANAPDSIMETTLVVLSTSSLNSSISICDGESYSVGSSVYTTAGVYTDVLTNAVGCDSIVTTTLSVLPSPSVPVVTQLFSTTLTTGVYDAYQWYRDGVLMAGETNQNLNIWQSGMYSVVVFNADGCGTESAGFPFGVTAIDEILLEEFSAYPNPTIDVLHLTTPDVLGKDYVIEVYDFIGRKLFEMDNAKLQLTRPLIDISKLAPANYKLFIRYADGEIWNTTINKQ